MAETYFSDILTGLVFGRFQDHLIKSASMPTRRDLKDTWGPKMAREKKTEILFFVKLLNIKLSLLVKRATFHFLLETYECNLFLEFRHGDIFTYTYFGNTITTINFVHEVGSF